ncbi:MAG: chloride channel protein [Deltaproteobacteria bacterium]|nr:chloride channel protein [Deltaproteobacteria bacterium]
MIKEASHRILPFLRKLHLNERVYLSIVAIIIGLLSGYGAVLCRLAIKAAQFLFYQNTNDILTFHRTLPIYLKIGLPTLGGLVVGPLIYFGAREAKGHGVPEVMEAVAIKGGRIRPRVALVKILASAITIGSGGSVGREGPMVQIGSSIGSTIAQILRAPSLRQRTFVGCGAAAGIAATFNAPIAGALFAAEIILGDFGISTFSPVVLSSVSATIVSRHYFGNFPAFIIPTYKLVSLWEYIFYPILGIVAGFVALLFIVVLYKFEDSFDAMKIPEYFKPALGGLFLGCILVLWPNVFGVGYGSINLALKNHLSAVFLLGLVFLKILATSITLGSGASGGIFAPSLFIGAMTGGFFGWGVHTLFPMITGDSGAYALVAMGAVVAGTTHAPITAIIIIFELTASYQIMLPLMFACIISTLIASSLKHGSIYTLKLSRRGVRLLQGWEQSIMQAIKVKDIMSDHVVAIPESMPLDEVINSLKTQNVSYLHVIDKDNNLTGIISFRDIRATLQEETLNGLVIARDVATIHIYTIRPTDSILRAFQDMGSTGISQLPVVAENDSRKVIGTVSQRDVMAAYDKAVLNREIDGY